jgi:hypothetical protein
MLADRAAAAKGELDRLVGQAAERLAKGEAVSGWPKLAETLGAKRTDKLAAWLNLGGTRPGPDDRKRRNGGRRSRERRGARRSDALRSLA